MRLRILDRYLLGSFGRMFAGVVAACAVLLLLTELIRSFQDIVNNECPFGKVLLYFVYFLPYPIIEILPLISTLSVLLSIGALAHNREMLAITAAGQSPLRVSAPLIAAGFVISAAALAAGEFIVPYTETQAMDIRKIYIESNSEGGKGRVLRTDVFAKGEKNYFYLMQQFRNEKPLAMVEPTIVQVSPDSGRLASRLSASRAVLEDAQTSDGLTLWRMEDAVRMEFNEKGRLIQTLRYPAPIRVKLEKNLHKYLATRRKPEEMGAIELAGYIAMLQAHNEPDGVYRTDFWLKLLFPFASLIFVISGFSFAMRAQVGAVVLGFAQGILCAAAFYGLTAFTQALGHRGWLPPAIAALFPMIAFCVLSVHALRRSAYTMT